MVDKYEIANSLRETGLLLQAKGENAFKAKAYLAGARTIESITEDIATLIEEERLVELPGIGPSLASYIAELFKKGETKLLDRLHEELPAGTAELSQIKGLTLKRIQLLNEKLAVSNISELKTACLENKLGPIKGLGVKLQKELLKSIDKNNNGSAERIRLIDGLNIAEEVVDFLKVALKTSRVAIAGETRRWQEEIDKVTIVAEATKQAVAQAIKKYHNVVAIKEKEERVESPEKPLSEPSLDESHKDKLKEHLEEPVLIILGGGITVEIFAVSNLAFGLFVHTGTPKHFAELQNVAHKHGYELSTNALDNGRSHSDFKNEEEIFSTLKLNYIPPEVREGEGEVKYAAKHTFDDLVHIEDIRGMTHCHSTFSDGAHTIEQMARACQKMGMEYMTLTDHSPTAHYAGGLDIERLKEQWEEIDRVQEKLKIKILKGTELDILADGRLDYPDYILEKFDIIIASIHSRYRQDEESMTKRLLAGLKNPHFKIWGHPLGRLVLKRDPIPCDVEEILNAIADAKVAIEINGDPYRMDLAPEWCKIAKKLGLKFVISTDAHSTSNLQNLDFGIHMARRAWIKKHEVLNTLPVEQFRRAVRTK